MNGALFVPHSYVKNIICPYIAYTVYSLMACLKYREVVLKYSVYNPFLFNKKKQQLWKKKYEVDLEMFILCLDYGVRFLLRQTKHTESAMANWFSPELRQRETERNQLGAGSH